MARSFVNVSLSSLFIYVVLVGGAFWGILIPVTRLLTLILLMLLVIAWMVVRTRAHWQWHATPLDVILPVWALVFVISLLLNPEAARRSVLAMWFMGVYVGLWYLLYDAVANRALPRQLLMGAVLVTGLILIASTIPEIPIAVSWLQENRGLYRFFSILGNPNTLAAFLTLMIWMTVGLIFSVHSQAARVTLVALGFLAAGVILLTFSRGAWLAMAGAITTCGIVLVRQKKMTLETVRAGWHQSSAAVKWGISLFGLSCVLAGIFVTIQVVRSFTENQRGLAYRPELFNVAFHMFDESPLFGKGLFSFGRYEGLYFSLPPDQYFAHPHSLPVDLAGGLGLAGLAAAAITTYLILRSVGRIVPDTSEHRARLAAGVAGVAFGLVNLFDIVAILPSIALTGILVLVAATASPESPVEVRRRWWPGRGLILTSLWGVLFVAGFWDVSVYTGYFDALQQVTDGAQYGEIADAIQPAADADPSLVVYPAQQAYLWGLAAHDGDGAARSKAVAAYEQAITLEPFYAPFYTNLAALYWSAEEQRMGFEQMQEAARLAPGSWQIQYNLGMYAEVLGEESVARNAYDLALQVDPDADLHPDWGQTAMQAEYHSAFEDRSPEAQVVLLMEGGQVDEAIQVWNSEFSLHSPQVLVLRELLALAVDERDDAAQWYEQALRVYRDRRAPLWLLMGKARLAAYDGDESTVTQVLAEADELLAYDPNTADYDQGTNMAIFQYHRQAIPRQFLPEVFYPTVQPVLLHLLAETG